MFNTSVSGWSELETEGAPPCARYKHGACLIPERRGGARMLILGGQDEEGIALSDQHVLNLAPDAPKTWAVLETSGTRPSPRYGHSVTLLPAQRKVIVLGGTDGKHIDTASVMDAEFPSHKTTKSLHPIEPEPEP